MMLTLKTRELWFLVVDRTTLVSATISVPYLTVSSQKENCSYLMYFLIWIHTLQSSWLMSALVTREQCWVWLVCRVQHQNPETDGQEDSGGKPQPRDSEHWLWWVWPPLFWRADPGTNPRHRPTRGDGVLSNLLLPFPFVNISNKHTKSFITGWHRFPWHSQTYHHYY